MPDYDAYDKTAAEVVLKQLQRLHQLLAVMERAGYHRDRDRYARSIYLHVRQAFDQIALAERFALAIKDAPYTEVRKQSLEPEATAENPAGL